MHRKLPLARRNVLTVLFSFNIELINLLISHISFLGMFFISVSDFNFVIAQIMITLTNAEGCIVCELFFSMSVAKIILVTNFSWIFPYDPNQLGKIIICVAAVVGFLPCLAVCVHETIQGNTMTNMVAYLANMPYCHQKMPFLQAYLIFWALLACCTLVLTLLYIPHHLKKYVNSQAIQTGECNDPKKEINLKKILVGLFGILFHLVITVIVNHRGLYHGMPVNALSSTASLNLMLVFFIFDNSVWDFLQEIISRELNDFKKMFRGTKVSPQPHQLQV
jgi:hypothetical protein